METLFYFSARCFPNICYRNHPSFAASYFHYVTWEFPYLSPTSTSISVHMLPSGNILPYLIWPRQGDILFHKYMLWTQLGPTPSSLWQVSFSCLSLLRPFLCTLMIQRIQKCHMLSTRPLIPCIPTLKSSLSFILIRLAQTDMAFRCVTTLDVPQNCLNLLRRSCFTWFLSFPLPLWYGVLYIWY